MSSINAEWLQNAKVMMSDVDRERRWRLVQAGRHAETPPLMVTRPSSAMASLHEDVNEFVGFSDVSVAHHQSSCVLIDSSTEPSTELEQLLGQSITWPGDKHILHRQCNSAGCGAHDIRAQVWVHRYYSRRRLQRFRL